MGFFLPHGGFFFLKGFTVVFDSKIFFSNKKNSKKNFFESKTTVNRLRKKKPHQWGKQTLHEFLYNIVAI